MNATTPKTATTDIRGRDTMTAAVYRRFGGPDVVTVDDSVPMPAVTRTDVLIKVHATTVSAADHRARSGDIPRGLRVLAGASLGFFRPRRPILGMDVAGVVAAVGADVTAFSPGDEVIALTGFRFGGHAEYATVPHDGVITAKPANMSFEEAVTLVFGGTTAQSFLSRVAVGASTTVLVNGASGAVGTAVVQLAAQAGASVTGVCSGANAELVRGLGADTVVDYATEDFTRLAPSSYDVVVDCVGNAGVRRAGHLVRPGGALLLVITDLAGLVSARWHSRRTGKQVAATAPACTAEQLAQVVKLAEAGQFRAVTDRTFPLAEIAQAHRYVDGGHKKGNVVVRVTT